MHWKARHRLEIWGYAVNIKGQGYPTAVKDPKDGMFSFIIIIIKTHV